MNCCEQAELTKSGSSKMNSNVNEKGFSERSIDLRSGSFKLKLEQNLIGRYWKAELSKFNQSSWHNKMKISSF